MSARRSARETKGQPPPASAITAKTRVNCQILKEDGSVCGKDTTHQARPWQNLMEHIRRTHADHFISGLRSTPEDVGRMFGMSPVTVAAPRTTDASSAQSSPVPNEEATTLRSQRKQAQRSETAKPSSLTSSQPILRATGDSAVRSSWKSTSARPEAASTPPQTGSAPTPSVTEHDEATLAAWSLLPPPPAGIAHLYPPHTTSTPAEYNQSMLAESRAIRDQRLAGFAKHVTKTVKRLNSHRVLGKHDLQLTQTPDHLLWSEYKLGPTRNWVGDSSTKSIFGLLQDLAAGGNDCSQAARDYRKAFENPEDVSNVTDDEAPPAAKYRGPSPARDEGMETEPNGTKRKMDPEDLADDGSPEPAAAKRVKMIQAQVNQSQPLAEDTHFREAISPKVNVVEVSALEADELLTEASRVQLPKSSQVEPEIPEGLSKNTSSALNLPSITATNTDTTLNHINSLSITEDDVRTSLLGPLADWRKENIISKRSLSMFEYRRIAVLFRAINVRGELYELIEKPMTYLSLGEWDGAVALDLWKIEQRIVEGTAAQASGMTNGAKFDFAEAIHALDELILGCGVGNVEDEDPRHVREPFITMPDRRPADPLQSDVITEDHVRTVIKGPLRAWIKKNTSGLAFDDTTFAGIAWWAGKFYVSGPTIDIIEHSILHLEADASGRAQDVIAEAQLNHTEEYLAHLKTKRVRETPSTRTQGRQSIWSLKGRPPVAQSQDQIRKRKREETGAVDGAGKVVKPVKKFWRADTNSSAPQIEEITTKKIISVDDLDIPQPAVDPGYGYGSLDYGIDVPQPPAEVEAALNMTTFEVDIKSSTPTRKRKRAPAHTDEPVSGEQEPPTKRSAFEVMIGTKERPATLVGVMAAQRYNAELSERRPERKSVLMEWGKKASPKVESVNAEQAKTSVSNTTATEPTLSQETTVVATGEAD